MTTMKSVLSPDCDAEILEQIVSPSEGTFAATAARALLKLSFSDEQQEEIRDLLDRNNAGTITPAEHDQLEAYVRVGNFLSLVKAKARRSLARKSTRK